MSVTLTPMLCSRFLKVTHAKTGFAGLMDRGFDRLQSRYARSLGLVLRHRLVMLVVFVAVLWATVYMFGIVPKGFIPDSDNDSLFVNLRAAQGTSFYEMVDVRENESPTCSTQNPNIDAMMVNTGGGNAGGQNTGRINIQLTPRASRSLTAAQMAQQLRPSLGAFPGVRGTVNVPPALQIGGFQGNSTYNLMVQSLNYRGAVPMDAEARGGDLAAARSAGRHDEPRVTQPARRSRHRPRQGGGRRTQRVHDRQRAQHGPRPALVHHHLRPALAVPRAARAGSEVSAAGRLAANS